MSRDEKADLDSVRGGSPPATDREVRLLRQAADQSRIRWCNPISRKPPSARLSRA